MKSISLKKALLANSAFSLFCAVDLLFFSSQIASIIGSVEPWILQLVGAGLIVWAVDLIWVATRPVISRALVKGIVIADLAWVLGTAILLVAFPGVFSEVGVMMLVAVASAVLVIALLQSFALSKPFSNASPQAMG